MTRLKSYDILKITDQLEDYNHDLAAKTGHSLRQIACHAVELDETDALEIIPRTRVGVVPIQWGQGLIRGFSEATAGILRFVGFDAFVTDQTDISGLAEACETKADVIFLSDDNDFIAINLNTRRHIHNADATGRGFAAGLDLMTGGVTNQKVLVLGCGLVGRSAASTLMKFGANVSIYDINPLNSREFADSVIGFDTTGLTVEQDLTTALSGKSLLVDATNTAEIIHAGNISPETYIAAPGMPLGLSSQALKKVRDRLLHDPLQIGVATMGMAVVKQLLEHT